MSHPFNLNKKVNFDVTFSVNPVLIVEKERRCGMSEFEELYNSYYKDVYYFVLKLTGYQEHITEEVTQETFFQAFLSLKRFRGECSIKSWLCQIAKNTYYKYLRTHAKETFLEAQHSQESEEKSVSVVAEEKQMIFHIRTTIAELDERSQRIVEYRLFGEKSYKEIGELLGIREATAKVLFSRAKVKIQQQLKEEYGYEI